jgi:hypothetical protein
MTATRHARAAALILIGLGLLAFVPLLLEVL